MNFFDHQSRAKQRTGLLLFLFACGIVGIAACIWGLVALGLGQQAFRPEIIVGTLVGVGGLVSLGSLYRTVSLSAGGSAVASQLGGRLLDPANTREPLERRLLNVVEEMALASGVPVPPVYVMDNEPGINAFAAGKTIGDAVIGVTRGTLEALSRDELQGVIAHEFSHILNGDMRLNIRLIGLIHGILLIALVGRLMVQLAGRSSSIRSSSSERGNSFVGLAIFGLGLLMIGSIGSFFSNLIKAAVSRQREFLADASAVQFTRNPDGIAGALKKIGALSFGSHVKAQGAEEVSHMFFADGLQRLFGGFLATHPPLIRRIKAIDPNFNGDFAGWLASQQRRREAKDDSKDSYPKESKASRPPLTIPGLPQIPGFPGVSVGFAEQSTAGKSLGHKSASARAPHVSQMVSEIIDKVGLFEVSSGHWLRADLNELPEPILDACRDLYGAATLLTGLILSSEAVVQRAQLEQVSQVMGEVFAADSLKLTHELMALTPARRIAVLEILAPPLRALSPGQYSTLARLMRTIMELDGQICLFEFAVHRSLIRLLDQHFGLDSPPRVNRRSLAKLSPQIRILLGFLAASNGSEDGGASAYSQAVSLLPGLPQEDRVPPPPEFLKLEHLDNALDDLVELVPDQRGLLLQACATAILSDGKLLPEEFTLIRAIASSLDCPMPPLLIRGVIA